MIITLPSSVLQGARLKFNNQFIMNDENCSSTTDETERGTKALQKHSAFLTTNKTQVITTSHNNNPQQRRTALIKSIYKQNRRAPTEQHVNYKAAQLHFKHRTSRYKNPSALLQKLYYAVCGFSAAMLGICAFNRGFRESRHSSCLSSQWTDGVMMYVKV